jgi:hypothetical protein
VIIPDAALKLQFMNNLDIYLPFLYSIYRFYAIINLIAGRYYRDKGGFSGRDFLWG